MNTLKKFFSRKTLVAAGSTLFALTLLVGGFSFMPQKAHALAISGDLHGYAWSDTIGWISLNCAEGGTGRVSICGTNPYKVKVTGDNFSGYAWSDNVGWISFNTPDVTTPILCGTGRSGVLDDVTGNVTGWARVKSGTTISGADGCLSLSGGSGTSAYGMHYNAFSSGGGLPGYLLSGFAWGSVNLGWVDFSYASLDAAAVGATLLVSKDTSFPDQLVLPGTVHQQLTSFTIKNLSTTEAVGITNLTYGISASGTVTLGNLSNLKVSVNSVPVGTTIAVPLSSNVINIAPTTIAAGGTITVTFYADFGAATSGLFHSALSAVGTGIPSGLAATSGAAVPGQKDTLLAALPPGTVMIKANGVSTFTFPTSAGGPVTLTWAAAPNVTSCTPLGTETNWNPTTPSSISLLTGSLGPFTVPANTTTSTVSHLYRLNCATTSGPRTPVAQVDVPPLAPTLDFKVNYGPSYSFPDFHAGTAQLTWTSTRMTSCSVDSAYTTTSYWSSGSTLPTSSGPYAIMIPAAGVSADDWTYGIKCSPIGGGSPITAQVTIHVPAHPGTTGTGTGGTGGTRPIIKEI